MANRSLKSHLSPLFRSMLLACLALAVPGCIWIQPVNVSSTEEPATVEGNGVFDNKSISVSADGRYVAFESRANNLVPGDTNGVADVFVRDTLNGTTTRVSVDSAGAQGIGGGSDQPSISDDGRYVTFRSLANNLVAGDTNGASDVFVRDTLNGTTTRVSLSSAEAQAINGNSDAPSISGDGHYVAFASNATNLVPGDTVCCTDTDVFVRDMLNGTTTLVSVGTAGFTQNHGGVNPSISSDGRYVAFSSQRPLGGTNYYGDIYVHDTHSGTTALVSVGPPPVANVGCFWASISGDGRYVAFESSSNSLVAGDTGYNDVFVRDTLNGITTRISVNSAGGQANLDSYAPSISRDGRYVAFYSFASNLVAGDIGYTDVFVRDTLTGITTLVSRDAQGTQGNWNSGSPSISANGRYVAFHSGASNLYNNTNGSTNAVITAVPTVTVTSVTPHVLYIGATTAVTVSGTNFLPGSTPLLSGAQFSNIVIVDENTITANVAVKADTPAGTQTLSVGLPGTGAGPLTGSLGSCTNCVTFSPPPGC